MRLDKYLKYHELLRRTVAKEVLPDKGRIKVEMASLPKSFNRFKTQMIRLKFALGILVTCKVLEMKRALKRDAAGMYELLVKQGVEGEYKKIVK
ncbi:RNA-binding S4 domain-containing protein [Streptococcus infantis]|nr:RNA-binding S4 domain-containing protein [Streptococcus infantis]